MEVPVHRSELPMRTNAYVGGFNRYRRAMQRTSFKWLNLHNLFEALFPDDPRRRICCFTTRR